MTRLSRSLSLATRKSLGALRVQNRLVRALALVFAWLLISPQSGHAFLEIARGELILNTTLRGAYDSNLFARRDSEQDLFVSLIPELQFLRQAGKGMIDARGGVNVTRFLDVSEEDFEDFYASLRITYPTHPDSPLSGGVTAAYTQLSSAIDLVNTRIRTETTTFGADTLYLTSERLGIRNSLAYEYTAFEAFSNVESYEGSLGLQWVYSEKLNFFSDYRIRNSLSTGENPFDGRSVNNVDHALLFGATGALRPRVDGTVSIGYQHTNARGAEADRGLVIAGAEVQWDWRPRTSLILTALRDLDISPTDETVETTNIALGAEHEIDPKISLTGLIGYRHFDFRGRNHRTDHALLAGLGLRYLFTRYWNAGFNWDFTFNDSNMPESDYTRHLVQLFTRYSF